VPYTPTRDGNLHIHKQSRYVDGSYHDTWHPVKRSHKNITEEGRELHAQHLVEIGEEKEQKEQAIRAKFPGKCSLCQDPVAEGDEVWWSPSIKMVRHRGAGTCDGKLVAMKPRIEDIDIALPERPTKASKEDFQRFKDQMDEMRGQVTAAEQKATIARKASEAAQEETKKAIARIDNARRVEIEVTRTLPGGQKKTRKLKAQQHVNFPRLLKLIAAGINTAMVGDAGSGKTVAGRNAAKALGLDFYHQPLGPQTSKSDLVGYMSGSGKYVPSLVRMGCESGGLIELDEMDAANPAILTIVNALVDAKPGEAIGFPDGMVKKHPDSVFVAAMNTFGRGADMLYVGRAQLDAATLNRWVYLEWNTDWSLAHSICGERHKEWTAYVQSLCESIARQKIRAIIGMRTALIGARMLDEKIDREEVEQAVIWQPISKDDKEKILAGLNKREPSHVL
jgi:hypothetical protein